MMFFTFGPFANFGYQSLILLNVGGRGGQPLSLKSIPKVKRQMPLPRGHTQAPILTQWTVFVDHLGFRSITDQDERPCTS